MFRSLFSRSRTVRVPIEHASSGVQVQKVRLYQPPVRPSLLLSTFFFAYVVFRLLEHSSTQSESEKGKQQWEVWKKRQGFGSDVSSDTRDHQHTREVGLPSGVISVTRIPIWFREKRGRLYQESDPEFQEFVRFQSDQKRISSVIQNVTQTAQNSMKQKFHAHKRCMIWVGYQGPAVVPLTDVTLAPQVHSPPSYEVPTLFVYKDGISAGWTTLPPDVGRKWNVIFQPIATWTAAKTSIHVFFHMSYHIVNAKISGSTLVLPPLPGVLSGKSSSTGKDKPGETPVIKTGDKTVPPSATTAASVAELVKIMHDGQTGAQRHSEMLAHVPLSYPIKAAAIAFRRKQMEAMSLRQVEQVRGSIKITGKMVYEGRFGKYVINVTATYIPAEDRFLNFVEYKPVLIADFAARQKMLDWGKKNLKENGGHHRCPPDGNCPIHGKVQHKPNCSHNTQGKPKDINDSVTRPPASDTKPSADGPTPEKNK